MPKKSSGFQTKHESAGTILVINHFVCLCLVQAREGLGGGRARGHEVQGLPHPAGPGRAAGAGGHLTHCAAPQAEGPDQQPPRVSGRAGNATTTSTAR